MILKLSGIIYDLKFVERIELQRPWLKFRFANGREENIDVRSFEQDTPAEDLMRMILVHKNNDNFFYEIKIVKAKEQPEQEPTVQVDLEKVIPAELKDKIRIERGQDAIVFHIEKYLRGDEYAKLKAEMTKIGATYSSDLKAFVLKLPKQS
jgi:hypothetical protein